MKINFNNIKNLIVGLVFTGMGAWCISLDFTTNIKLVFFQSVIESSVSEIEDYPDPGRMYRIKGKFDFSSYYIVKNVRDSRGGYSEEVKAYLYRLRGVDSQRDLLIKSDSSPVSMERLYSRKSNFLVTIKEFASRESFSLIVAGSRSNSAAYDPGNFALSFIDGLFIGDRVITAFYGEMHNDVENAKSMAAGELIWKIFLGAFMIFIGLLVLSNIKLNHSMQYF